MTPAVVDFGRTKEVASKRIVSPIDLAPQEYLESGIFDIWKGRL
jgi:hypothetical protein